MNDFDRHCQKLVCVDVIMAEQALGTSMNDLKQPNWLDSEIESYKADIDRTLLRHNLRLTVEQRLQQLIQQARLADEFDRSRQSRTKR